MVTEHLDRGSNGSGKKKRKQPKKKKFLTSGVARYSGLIRSSDNFSYLLVGGGKNLKNLSCKRIPLFPFLIRISQSLPELHLSQDPSILVPGLSIPFFSLLSLAASSLCSCLSTSRFQFPLQPNQLVLECYLLLGNMSETKNSAPVSESLNPDPNPNPPNKRGSDSEDQADGTAVKKPKADAFFEIEADAAEDKGSRHTMEDAWVVLLDAAADSPGKLRSFIFPFALLSLFILFWQKIELEGGGVALKLPVISV